MKRALLLLPIAFAALTFHSGFDAWFQQDDFAHLKLAAATPPSRLIETAMTPLAQGTFRPFSERLFYWAIYRCCELDPLPARFFGFGIQAANLILFGLLLRRVTGSPAAAVCGSTFWAVNPAITVSMTWVAATNQLLAAFCFLSATYGFARYCDTNRRLWLAISWLAFLFGFGVLEITVVIPVILTAYAAFFARTFWKAALTYWPAAVAFGAWHTFKIPKSGGATYQLVFDSGIFSTLATYLRWSVLFEGSVWMGFALLAAGVAALWRCAAPRAAWFGAAWFLAALAPVLPLKNHLSDYYLTVPLLGLGIIIAAMAPIPRTAFSAIYLVLAVSSSLAYSARHVAKSHDIQAIVLGVKRIAELHPGKSIYLSGITDDLFWSGIYDRPFTLVGARETYLLPEDAAKLAAYSELSRHEFTTPPETFSYLVASGDAVVYAYENRRLKQVTESFELAEKSRARAQRVRQILTGQTAFQPFLGPEWYRPDSGFRWMPGTATARLQPDKTDKTIVLRGFCAKQQAAGGAVRVAVEWNGASLGEQPLSKCPGLYELRFPSPRPLGDSGQLRITASPEIQIPGDNRRLALAVIAIESRENP